MTSTVSAMTTNGRPSIDPLTGSLLETASAQNSKNKIMFIPKRNVRLTSNNTNNQNSGLGAAANGDSALGPPVLKPGGSIFTAAPPSRNTRHVTANTP